MSDFNKKATPQRVNADLFSTPSTSSGLSLGFDEPFSSPFALVAANKDGTSECALIRIIFQFLFFVNTKGMEP